MTLDPIVIVSAARTPIGGLLGDFAALPAWQLGATAVAAAVQRAVQPAASSSAAAGSGAAGIGAWWKRRVGS